MSKAIKLTREFEEFEFLKYYKEHRFNRYIYRCLACHYIQNGDNYDEVATMMHYSRKSIMLWVKKFKDGGIESLLSTAVGRGRKPMLSTDLSEEFSKSVIALQENKNGGRIIGEDIVDLVQKKYSVEYSLSGIYKLLSRMGLSWVSARSIHPKADIEVQESFKKTLKRL